MLSSLILSSLYVMNATTAGPGPSQKDLKKKVFPILKTRTLETVVDEGLEVTAFSKKLMRDRATQAELF